MTEPQTSQGDVFDLTICAECGGAIHTSLCDYGCPHDAEPMETRPTKLKRYVALDDVTAALSDYYHPQNPKDMHPADFVTKRFEGEGHENLSYV